jgi:uncharacterized protein (TIGR01777 family)
MAIQRFEYKTRINANAKAVFDWHESPGAFERLAPDWLPGKVIERVGGINGGTVTLLITQGPAQIKWKLGHDQYIPGVQFRDFQVSGPFKTYNQIHRVEPDGDSACYLIDRVEFELPDYVPAKYLASGYIEGELGRLFQFRHRLIAGDFADRDRYGGNSMKVLITGSTGMIGSALIPLLTTQGHTVTRLVRPKTKVSSTLTGPSINKLEWDPRAGRLDVKAIDGFDAVINLAGDSIAGGRWTPEKKRELRDSRIVGTRLLADTLTKTIQKPKVFLSASAIGFYGDRGSETLTEDASKGKGFLSDLAEEWEVATSSASEAGIRTVNYRIGVVLSTKGGALKQMLLPFQLGAGGRIGSGKQYFSWITLEDVCGAMLHALSTDSISGPLNATAPNPVTNNEFTKALGKVLFRPTLIPIPTPGLELLFGAEMADEVLIAGQKVVPAKLQGTNYQFRQTQIEPALRSVLGK